MKSSYHHGALPVALIKATEIILERDGIGALTLRGVARQAGVSHAAPTHHFGDLSGLLTALAASGFVRLRESVQAEVKNAGVELNARLTARGRGYVNFAKANPALFQLMFRSERLNWSNEVLSNAGKSAFALLTLADADTEASFASYRLEELATIAARWSLMHGLSMLLIDGRLGAFAEKVPDGNVEALIEQVLEALGHICA